MVTEVVEQTRVDSVRLFPFLQPYDVSREKIREFAQAIGADDPVHTDPRAARALGYPDVIAPPTFLVLLTLPYEIRAVSGQVAGFELTRTLHRSLRFRHHRPVGAGDRLVVAVEVGAVELVGDSRVVAVETLIRDADGEPICTAMSDFVCRARVRG